MSDSLKWDKRYRSADQAGQVPLVLSQHSDLLPKQGRALDLACGLGAAAMFLARKGFEVSAWDNSEVAINKLAQQANREGLGVQMEVRDVVERPPPPGSFDVICVSHFLDRAISDALEAALKPGGLLFYQTFGPLRNSTSGPRNPAFRLRENELPELFPSLKKLVHQEFSDENPLSRNDIFLFVGQMPASTNNH